MQNVNGGMVLMVESVGRNIGMALARGVQMGVNNALASGVARVAGAKVAKAKPTKTARAAPKALRCLAVGCKRPMAVRELCKSHYSKAKRNKMNVAEKLSAAALKMLGEDGRKS